MNPYQYENLVAEHYEKRGFKVTKRPYSNDLGVDLIAEKGDTKIAVQAKMYGNTSRKVNHEAVLYLQGAKEYFDCNAAAIATNGSLLPDAEKIACKLGIEILHISTDVTSGEEGEFEMIWKEYILPLEGKTLLKENGKSNVVIKADWSGIKRKTSNGNTGFIEIEIFRRTVEKLVKEKVVTRDHINQHYCKRASSGICLILSQVPFIKYEKKPARLEMKG